MTNGITQLIKSVPILSPQDTIRRAAGLIRASDGTSVLVHDFGRIIGIVSEHGIAAYLAASDDLEHALDASIMPLIDPNIILVNSAVTRKEAADIFVTNNTDMLPVIDNKGSYIGIIYRRDVIGLLTQNLRPPVVAGMATPLGVYLTTGSISGGAGSFGLFLTGASLAMMIVGASLIADWLMRFVASFAGAKISLPFIHMLYVLPGFGSLFFYASTVLRVGIFFVLLRLSPLSGYHAAEHMTVNAIESGDALTPDTVKPMPRVHPRCGTNLLAGAGAFVMISSRLGGEAGILLALAIVFIGWRTIGGWLQYFVTTRKPSERQLANGVAAGNELLKHYQEQPSYQLTGLRRMWKLGFPQTALGMFTMLWLLGKIFRIPMM